MSLTREREIDFCPAQHAVVLNSLELCLLLWQTEMYVDYIIRKGNNTSPYMHSAELFIQSVPTNQLSTTVTTSQTPSLCLTANWLCGQISKSRDFQCGRSAVQIQFHHPFHILSCPIIHYESGPYHHQLCMCSIIRYTRKDTATISYICSIIRNKQRHYHHASAVPNWYI